jgi:hypothetical protein
MPRRTIAAAWIFGATIPLLLGTAWVLGCCVLPFHAVMHKAAPVCHAMANHAMAGNSDAPMPARERQEPLRRIAITLFAAADDARPVGARYEHPPLHALRSHRSFIALGAVRCDRDVGLHVLVDTFRI